MYCSLQCVAIWQGKKKTKYIADNHIDNIELQFRKGIEDIPRNVQWQEIEKTVWIEYFRYWVNRRR